MTKRIKNITFLKLIFCLLIFNFCVCQKRPSDKLISKLNNELVMSEGMVNVWQFYIFGKKPVGLKEARDSLVNVFFKKGYKPIYPNAGKFIPSKPQIINGRQYSGKVIDIISEQNISVEHIERCIEKGRQWQDGEYISYLCPSDLSHKPCTISLDKDGRVVRIN